jgi:FtsH-binding integral membrane protein
MQPSTDKNYPYSQAPPPYGFAPNNNNPPGPQGYNTQSHTQEVFPPMMPNPHMFGGAAPGGGGRHDLNNMEANSFFSSPQAFSDIKIRHQFIRKVYSIVSMQLLVTFACSAIIIYVPPLKGFFLANSWILWLLLAGTFVVMLVLACCESVARSYPLNLILLSVFTLMESLLVGCICSVYKTDTVLIAAGITLFIVVGLTLFAFQTKIDFTGMGTYLFVAGLVLFGFGFLAIIFRSNIMHLVYAAAGAGLFSMYLVFDTQLMMGGKHKYSISPEDYIMAALSLYMDIINLFLMILRLVSAAKD